MKMQHTYRKYLSIFLEILPLIVLNICIIIWQQNSLTYEPDTVWHLKFGNELLDGRLVDGVDTWSWLRQENGEPLEWVQHEWLFALIQASLTRLGFSISFLPIICKTFILTYVWTFMRKCIVNVKSFIYFYAFTFLGFVFGMSSSARPHVLGFVLWLMYMRCIWEFDKTGKFNQIIYMSILTVLIVNIWGGTSLLSIGLLGTLFIQELLNKNKDKLIKIFTGLCMLGLSLLFSPSGWKSPLYILFNTANQELITEWQSPKFLSIATLLVLMLVYTLTRHKLRLKVFEWICLITFIMLTGKFLRFTWLISMLMFMIYLYRLPVNTKYDFKKKISFVNCVVLVISLILMIAMPKGFSRNPTEPFVKYVQHINPQKLYTPFVNDWAIWRNIKVFMDSRADPFGDTYTDFLEVECGLKSFYELHLQFNFDYVAVMCDSYVAKELDTELDRNIIPSFNPTLLFTDGKYNLYCLN